MQLTILGAGTCASQLPGIPNRQPPAFLVEWETEKVLFDCSEGVRFRLEAVGCDYAGIHHIAITHAHADHCALPHFIQSVICKGLWGGESFRNPEIFLYCPQQIADDFSRLWDFHFPDRQGEPFDWPMLTFRPMPSHTVAACAIGNASLSARRVYHAFGRIDAIAFRLETPEGIFVYSGDTGDCPGIREIARGADLFVSECSARIGDRQAPTGYGHLHPAIVGEIAREAAVKNLVLFHYTGLDSEAAILDDVRRSGYAGEIIVGKDYQQFTL